MQRSDFKILGEMYINAVGGTAGGTQPMPSSVAPPQSQGQQKPGDPDIEDETPELTKALENLTNTLGQYKADPKKSAAAMQKIQQAFKQFQPGQTVAPTIAATNTSAK